jgi:hypothetical protein
MGVGEGVFWRARVQEPSYGGWLSECTPDAISQRRECPRTRAYPAIAFGVESVSHCTPPPITAVPPLLSCAPQSELGGPRSVVQPQERMRHWGWLPAPRGAQGTLWRCKRPFEFPILNRFTPVSRGKTEKGETGKSYYRNGSCWIPGSYIPYIGHKRLILKGFFQRCHLGRDPRGKPVKTTCYAKIDPLRPWKPI